MKVILFANTDWYLYNFRLSLARAIRDAGYEILLLSPAGPYGEKLREQGFRWIAAPMNRAGVNPLRELFLLRWLWRLLLEEQPTLVHGFTIKCAIYGSLASRLAAWSGHDAPRRVNAVAGMGYVFTSGALKARILRPVVRALFRVAFGGKDARLILQNPDDAALFMRSALGRAGNIRLIRGSGVDCSRFTPPPQDRDASTARMRVLLPARLLWDKGIAEFAEAARILREEGRELDFLLAGTPDPGNPAAVPAATVRTWVDEGLLRWLGHVDDMPALFRAVDAVVLPSYREGLPKGLTEAAASGLPLVTTDAPGCREVVEHGVNGLLVPVRDGKSLARAIAALQDDPSLRRRYGVAARAKALAEFDQRIILDQTISVYRELMAIVR